MMRAIRSSERPDVTVVSGSACLKRDGTTIAAGRPAYEATYCIFRVIPPSSVIVSPVMNADASDSR